MNCARNLSARSNVTRMSTAGKSPPTPRNPSRNASHGVNGNPKDRAGTQDRGAISASVRASRVVLSLPVQYWQRAPALASAGQQPTSTYEISYKCFRHGVFMKKARLLGPALYKSKTCQSPENPGMRASCRIFFQEDCYR